jgi:hypothetical protein
MQHRDLRTRASATAKRFMLATAVAAAMLGTAAATTAFTSRPAAPATASPAAARPVTVSATASPAAARPATATRATATPAAKPARPESALARAFRKYFRHQAATGMTAWTKTGIESSNEAILMKARGDAYPHRNAALPADSAALAAAARNGLAHPSPVDTAGWNKIMHDELTIARQLPIPAQGQLATTQATVIRHDYLAFARATS